MISLRDPFGLEIAQEVIKVADSWREYSGTRNVKRLFKSRLELRSTASGTAAVLYVSVSMKIVIPPLV